MKEELTNFSVIDSLKKKIASTKLLRNLVLLPLTSITIRPLSNHRQIFVRYQMNWDGSRRSGTEALVHLGCEVRRPAHDGASGGRWESYA